ncbi:hypothetical protein AB7238_08010 [Providencia alcalifaciens]
MSINFILRTSHDTQQQCPNCGSSDDIIPWGNGWMCRDCGNEWDTTPSGINSETQ